MHIIHAAPLKAFIISLFETAGVEPAIAGRTADHLVDANLAGVDSHGVLRTPDYIAMVKAGRMSRTDSIQSVREFGATALWDAHYTFGQYSAWRAADKAIEKAKAFGIGMVAVRNSAHIGRLGEYAEQIAKQGLIGFITANLQGSGQRVAPFGGRVGRLGTNPLAWGVPTGGLPLVIDISTSYSAEGKVRVKLRRGEPLTPGWILDKDGRSSLNPADLYGPPYGALLTMGLHKGYGLSLIADVLGGVLPGGGYSRPGSDVEALENGFSVVAIHVEAFGDVTQFQASVTELGEYMKATPPVDGVAEVLIPNEPEHRERQKRRLAGIPIEDETWDRLAETARDLGVSVPQ
jgi:uncharacterized oxidoreductase